jgi:hypothetical protein
MMINVADLVDPSDPEGRTYRQINAARMHNIPIGTLVELDTGERLRVMMHTRDCDRTPLYSLGIAGDEYQNSPGQLRHGYDEECLKVIAYPSEESTTTV